MDYEWDKAKSALNRKKHGIGFEEIQYFNWQLAAGTETQTISGEFRDVWIGPLHGRLYAVIVTEKQTTTRVISLRIATNHEKQKWQNEFQR